MKKNFIVFMVLLLSNMFFACGKKSNELPFKEKENFNLEDEFSSSELNESDKKNKVVNEENNKENVNNEDNKETIKEENNNVEDSKEEQKWANYKTGPMIAYDLNFDSNKKFSEFIKKFNTLNKLYISFDLDDVTYLDDIDYNVGGIVDARKMYNAEITDQLFLEQSGYDMFYHFYSDENSVYCDNNPHFRINCSNIKVFTKNDISEESQITFEFQCFEKEIYNYVMKIGELEIMDIAIRLGEDEDETLLNDILKLLEESVVFLN